MCVRVVAARSHYQQNSEVRLGRCVKMLCVHRLVNATCGKSMINKTD